MEDIQVYTGGVQGEHSQASIDVGQELILIIYIFLNPNTIYDGSVEDGMRWKV